MIFVILKWDCVAYVSATCFLPQPRMMDIFLGFRIQDIFTDEKSRIRELDDSVSFWLCGMFVCVCLRYW